MPLPLTFADKRSPPPIRSRNDMIPIHSIRSTQHQFTRRVLFYPLLSSRCGISAVNIIRSDELRVLFFLFFSGDFYFLTLSLSKELFFKNRHFLKNKFAYLKNIVYLCITISNSATCLKTKYNEN